MLFRQQAGHIGPVGVDELKELELGIVDVEQRDDVHILDGHMVFGTDVDRALRPFELHAFHGPDQRIGAGVATVGFLQRFHKQDGGVHAIGIEQVGEGARSGPASAPPASR